MSGSPNKLIRFWQELKRRKVFSVVTTYAATAYIIIEVTNNLVEPLSLPSWIAKLVVLLLGAGLPVAAILSWIFDFTPQGIKKTESLEELEGKEIVIKPVERKLRASYVLNAVLIITVIFLAYPKIFKRDTLERLRSSGERISVAVLPFHNMTNDTTWNVWQDVIQINLITSLSSAEQLKVRQIETINSLLQGKGLTNYASITPSLASSVSKKLDADVFIYGSISQAASKVRINAQLINSNTEEVFKSFQIEGPGKEEMIFHIVDSLSIMVKNFLIISKLGKEESIDYQKFATTNSPEAYRYYFYGEKAFKRLDYYTATNWYLQTIAIDSNLADAFIQLSSAYSFQGMYDKARKWCLMVYKKRDLLPVYQKVYTEWWHARCFESPNEEIKYLEQLQELDDQIPYTYYLLGWDYRRLQLYDKAIPNFEKALEIYKKWGVKPWWIYHYTELGRAYHNTGQYRKERKIYMKAERDFPDNSVLIYRQVVLSLTKKSTTTANRYIEKYKSILKNNSWSEADIIADLASVYSEAGILAKSEEYYRQSLSLEPGNPDKLNNLAWFLIDKDRNVNEGLELVNKSLELKPESYNSLDTKGWGLYKKKKFKEALEIFQKSWDLRMQKAGYDHEAYLHLEAAKKAVAGMKSN
jgi:tetratricopeptide (TPR) repeat protein